MGIIYKTAYLLSLTILMSASQMQAAANSSTLKKELFWHVKVGRVEQVKRLLAEGANPNWRDSYNNTCLHYAVGKADRLSPAMVVTLLQADANPNAQDNDLATPLHNLIQWKGFEVLSKNAIAAALYLLSYGGDKFIIDASWWSPLEEIRAYYPDTVLHELIESYPGRTLQEQALFVIIQKYYSDNVEEHKRAVQEIEHIRHACPEHVPFIYRMIFKKLPKECDEKRGYLT